jgi:hypothetical protein
MKIQQGIRVFELTETVSGWLDGSLDDWPAQIQDPIFAALERKAQKVELPLAIVYSECRIDHDVPEGQPGYFYVYILASEIVVADIRNLRPGTVQ